MHLTLKHLLEGFEDNSFPPFPCPRCSATLVPKSKTLHIAESAESWDLHEVGAIGPDEGGGVFTVIMECSDSSCSESVAVAGKNHLTASEDVHGKECIAYILEPSHFVPHLNLFTVPSNVPESVKKPLNASFGLFWTDPSASGNSIRTAVEELMNYKRVKKWTNRPGKKRHPISLHDRILEFKESKRDLGELLLAIKWIGNAGSHRQTLEKKNIIAAYQMLEHVLQELFEKRTAFLAKTAKQINKRRKP